MSEVYALSNSPAMSDDIRMLTGAMIKAKKEFIATGLNGKNSHQNYNYAKLGDIYRAVETGLTNNEIMIVHFARKIDLVEHLFTRLIHSPSNQWIEDIRELECEKPGNQAKGSANTYMRKSAVLSLCAIDKEDDDGEVEEKHIQENNVTQKKSDFISADQLYHLKLSLKSLPTLERKILNHYKIDSFADLPWKELKKVKTAIENATPEVA